MNSVQFSLSFCSSANDIDKKDNTPESEITLPEELFIKIVSYLDDKSRTQAMLVNKSWKKAVILSITSENILSAARFRDYVVEAINMIKSLSSLEKNDLLYPKAKQIVVNLIEEHNKKTIDEKRPYFYISSLENQAQLALINLSDDDINHLKANYDCNTNYFFKHFFDQLIDRKHENIRIKERS